MPAKGRKPYNMKGYKAAAKKKPSARKKPAARKAPARKAPARKAPAKKTAARKAPAKRATKSSPTVRTPGYVQWKYETAGQYRDAGMTAGRIVGSIRRQQQGHGFLAEQPGQLSRGDARRHRVQGPALRSLGNYAGSAFAREQQRRSAAQWKKAQRRGYTGFN
jgi:hypothetical protein